MSSTIALKLCLRQGDAIAMGPGKADLLDAIVRTGSISAAGRQKGGGAQVTPLGFLVLERYRAMQAAPAPQAESPPV